MNLPRRLQGDSPDIRKKKNNILLSKSNFTRKTKARRAELYLAILDKNRDAVVYTMTYDEFDVPASYREMKLHYAAFIKSLRRRIGGNFDYCFSAEASHGEGRPHFHFIVNSAVKEEWVRKRWVHGGIRCSRLITDKELMENGYYDKALYYTKEPTGRFLPVDARAFHVSRSLQQSLPKPEKFLRKNKTIPLPKDAIKIDGISVHNDFGDFTYLQYLVQK